MNKNGYEVNLLINGKPAREYYHDNKFYVEARQNSQYSIKIKNHGYKKIMAVLSVDGIDVLKGKSATDAESGYIINPFSSTEIKGYRIDDDNVATFKFDDGKVSYSTQVEQKFDKKKIEKVQKGEIAPSKNNGVIGVRIWEEKETVEIPEWKSDYKISKGNFYGNYHISNGNILGSIYLSGCAINSLSAYSGSLSISGSGINSLSSINYTTGSMLYNIISNCSGGNITSNSNNSYTPNFELGTTWGNKEEDKVIKVQFIKADNYIDLELYYLKRDELIKLGIDIENAKKVFVSGYPKAFDNKEDYCKEPINWNKR